MLNCSSYPSTKGTSSIRFRIKAKIKRKEQMNRKNCSIKEHLSIRSLSFSKDVRTKAEK